MLPRRLKSGLTGSPHSQAGTRLTREEPRYLRCKLFETIGETWIGCSIVGETTAAAGPRLEGERGGGNACDLENSSWGCGALGGRPRGLGRVGGGRHPDL